MSRLAPKGQTQPQKTLPKGIVKKTKKREKIKVLIMTLSDIIEEKAKSGSALR
jgi:hypothetical protein